MTEKTEEQIAKDKEAVARMTGAKSAMEASLRRIELLEARLRRVKVQCAEVSKSFGDYAHFKVWKNGDHVVRSAKEIFTEIDQSINEVL